MAAFPIAIVTWLDAASSSNARWQHVDDTRAQSPILMETVGHLIFQGIRVGDDEETAPCACVTVASTYGRNENTSGDITIPLAMVLEMCIL